jgi:hypothetical protein
VAMPPQLPKLSRSQVWAISGCCHDSVLPSQILRSGAPFTPWTNS